MLNGITWESIRYKTTTSNWDNLDIKNTLDVVFTCFFTTNIYYGSFKKLLEGPFIILTSSNTTNCQSIIIHYGQNSELLKGSHPLESYRKYNINDDEVSLDGKKNKNKDKVKNKDDNKIVGSSKSGIDTKSEKVKKTLVNSDWDKNKDKNKDKKKNVSFSNWIIDF